MKSINVPLFVHVENIDDETRPDDHCVERVEYSYADYDKFHREDTQLLLPEKKPVIAVKRFVILVPVESFPVVDFLFQVKQYTIPGMTLLFVSCVTDPGQEITTRRQLMLMENMIRSPRLQVHSRIIYNNSWLKTIKEIWREGDLIICLEGHQDQQYLFRMIPLGKKVFSSLQVPVLIHKGIRFKEHSPYIQTMREIAAWSSFIVTISLFTFLQIKVDQSLHDWSGRLLLCLTVIVELFLIWKINGFFK